jgi:SPRY domain
MLICNVSLRPPRHAIAADLAEVAAALDASTTGQVVFATLVDDPASVSETVDAFTGEIMLEAASASDTIDVGFAYGVTIDEVTTSSSSENATIVSAPTTGWNPSDLVNMTLTNSNLTATGTAQGGTRATVSGSTGKKYWELTCTTMNSNNSGIGIATSTCNLTTVGGNQNQAVFAGRTGAYWINGSFGGGYLGGASVNNGDILSIAVDLAGKLIWFRKAPSGNWNGSAGNDPATGVGGISFSGLTAPFFPFVSVGAASEQFTANFGATTFSGSIPSGFSIW